MVEGPPHTISAGGASPERRAPAAASQQPPQRCLTPTCVLMGHPAYMGYCHLCAQRLQLVQRSPSTAGVASANSGRGVTPLSSDANAAATPPPSGGSCRGQCGFFGNAERCGLCSSCFGKIADDAFLVAVAGCVVNRIEAVVQYVSAGGSTKRCVTSNEADQLRRLHFYVADGADLSRIANEHQAMEVLMYVLEQDRSPVNDKYRRAPLSTLLRGDTAVQWPGDDDAPRDAVPATTEERRDDDDEPAISDDVRLELLSTQQTREDELVYFDTSIDPAAEAPQTAAEAPQTVAAVGKSFALPLVLRGMPEQARAETLSRFTEQVEMQRDIAQAIDFFTTVPDCDALVAIYTVADLNCLLHGVFTGMVGVRDGILVSDDPNASRVTTRTVLRNAVRDSLLLCPGLQLAVAPTNDQPTVVDQPRLQQLQRDIEHGKASLDGGHVFALANVLRRPIVVWAHEALEGSFRSCLRVPYRISGIYLPLLWDPADVIRDPLYLCYSAGHFSALVGCAESAPVALGGAVPRTTVAAPLCDEKYAPLPIHFADSTNVVALLVSRGLPASVSAVTASPDEQRLRHSGAELVLLRAYMRILAVAPLVPIDESDPTEDAGAVPLITIAEQWHALRPASVGDPTRTEQYVSRVRAEVNRLAHHVDV